MDNQDQGGVRTPKACRQCAKAKIRCEAESNGPCKRCRRLNKQCSGQAPGAHRQPRPRASPEISVLEAKLDRVVALLAASERSKDVTLDSSPAQSSTQSVDSVTPSALEGEMLLEIFRTNMSALFPFVILPAHVTADQLRRERPFLYLNICMIACQDPWRQRNMLPAVQQSVAERVVLRGEHNLDLLQGLLVHLAWFVSISRLPRSEVPRVPGEALKEDLAQSMYVQGSSQLDVYLSLAVSLVVSLNLNQGLIRTLDRPLSYMRAVDFHPDQVPPRSLEERRTYLGCYYLTVMLSACVRELEPLRFSSYTEECCRVLNDTKEFPTDTFSVHLVRVAHLADQIIQTVSMNALDSPVVLSPILGISIRSYQAQLQQLRASFAGDSPQSTVVLCHYDTLEIILYRLALSDELSDLPHGNVPVTRVDLLFHCLEATKSFFHNTSSIPLLYFPYLPFPLCCQFGQAIVNMSRILLYQNDNIGWDQSYVKTQIDFNETMNGLEQKLDDAGSVANGGRTSEEAPEVFRRMHARMDLMKEIHLKREETQKQAQSEAPEPPDFSFMLNMPLDAFFPYGDFGGFHSGFETPANLDFPCSGL